MYKKKVLSLAILAAISISAEAEDIKQKQSDVKDVEIIEVTGTRGSLTRALFTKRQTIGVVDSISAESLGQFPDQNVAESLQRISGVSIDRSGGEGQSITVRGLGPEFNTVLLNGRLLATDNPGREFSFDILPSELISGADVYKSSAANFQEGGIGSTVIIRTARPTDRAGFIAAGNIGGKYDSGSGETSPTASLLLSNSNDKQTFGTSLSFVYDKRETQIQRYSSSGWLVNKSLDFDKDGTPELTGVAVPRSFNQEVDKSSRERIGGTAALDWKISEDLMLTFDGLYTQYEVDSQINTLAYFTDESDIIDARVSENNTVTWFKRGDTGSLATDWVVNSQPRSSKTMQLGTNVEWFINDATRITTDLSYSKATGDDRGSPFFVLGSRNTGLNPIWDHSSGTQTPIISGVIAPTDNSDLRGHFGHKRGNKIDDAIMQLSIDVSTSFFGGNLNSIDYGLQFTDREKENTRYATPGALDCFYCGYFATVPSSVTENFTTDSFLGEGQLANTWLTYDPDALIAYYNTDSAITQKGDLDKENAYRAALASNNGDWRGELKPGASSVVNEKNWAAYVQANWEGELNDMEWDLIAGVRYVATEVTATGHSVQLLELQANAGDATSLTPVFSDILPIEETTSYDYFLPSATFRLDINDSLVTRLAGSRTLTRPTLTNLSTARSWGIRPPSSFTVSGGNPQLKPYLSWNFDLGLDYFINDVSYASVATYYKSIDNFVSLVTQPVDILGKTFQDTRPTNAENAKIYGIEASFQYTFDFLPAPWNGTGFSANYTKVESSVKFDPTLSTQVFNVEGLSDSANLVAFFETESFNIRAAYNWRDTFLLKTFGGEGQPETVDSYGQIDLSTSYQVSKEISAYIDVSNLTNELQSVYQAYSDRVFSVEDTGRRITFGVRAVF
ncbi:MAG: TonB-dependent receptor [Colwellia sp.]|nr:TonB-dependent receptor [Colwellia sp.]